MPPLLPVRERGVEGEGERQGRIGRAKGRRMRERGRRGSEREGKQCFISSFNFLLKRDTCKLEPDGRSVRDLLNTGMNVLPGDMVLVILPPTLHWLL